jgi:hypothetical protein
VLIGAGAKLVVWDVDWVFGGGEAGSGLWCGGLAVTGAGFGEGW